jgi:hypothetical protein
MPMKKTLQWGEQDGTRMLISKKMTVTVIMGVSMMTVNM